MRLKNYITEAYTEQDQKNFKKIKDQKIKEVMVEIEKKCKPYLNLIRGMGPFMRGMLSYSESPKLDKPESYVGKSLVRQDREGLSKQSKAMLGKGVNVTFFNAVNKWLEKNGHAVRNKSISCTSSWENAGYFGWAYYVFPIGNFKYTWVASKDFNEDYDYPKGWGPDKMRIYLWNWYKNQTDPELKFDPNDFIFTNKGIKEAYKKEFEIWFQCKEFYYIDANQNWNRIKEL